MQESVALPCFLAWVFTVPVCCALQVSSRNVFLIKNIFLNKKNFKKHFCLLWYSKQPQNLNFHECGGLDSAEGFDRWLLMSETILMEWEKDMGGRSKVHDSSYIFASSVLPWLDKVQPFFFLDIISYYNVLVWSITIDRSCF